MEWSAIASKNWRGTAHMPDLERSSSLEIMLLSLENDSGVRATWQDSLEGSGRWYISDNISKYLHKV